MIRRNIIANFVGRAWGIVSVYAFLPLYLKLLGGESYGLVGFYTTLISVLAFADMGFTATLNREMARFSVGKDSAGDKCNLLRTYESTYVCISLLMVVSIWFLSPLIAEYWLQIKTLNTRDITSVIRIMGVSIALQLPANLYIGGLMGLQNQVQANSLQIGWSMLRGVGSVLVLWLLSPTIIAFAWWQLISNIVYYFFARGTLWRAVYSGGVKPRFKWRVFQDTWRYSAGIVGMALISTLLTQTDKLVVSKMLPLETFGFYMVAVALASVPGMLASPISRAIFPRFTGLVESGDQNGLVKFYHTMASIVAVVIIPGGLTLAFFSGDFILAWTGNSLAAQQAGVAASFLITGTLMQSITVAPFYVALAHGNVRLNLQIGIISLVLLVPLLLFFVPKYGLMGAGMSWMIMNLCTLFPYMHFLHRRFLPGEFRKWCFCSVGRPLFTALPLVLLGRLLVPYADSRLLVLVLISFVWVVATVATAIANPELRNIILKFMRNFYEKDQSYPSIT